MKNIIFLMVLAVALSVLQGCADMDTTSAENLLKNPLGQGSVKIGMTKNEVLSIYGDPTAKEMVTSSEWSGDREEWFYNARYTSLPVSVGFMSESLYIYFDGNNVTNVTYKPLETIKKDIK